MPTIRTMIEDTLDRMDAERPSPGVQVALLRGIVDILLDTVDELDPAKVFDRAVESLRDERDSFVDHQRNLVELEHRRHPSIEEVMDREG